MTRGARIVELSATIDITSALQLPEGDSADASTPVRYSKVPQRYSNLSYQGGYSYDYNFLEIMIVFTITKL